MNSFLLDGPLMSTFERRKATLERMAKDLVEHQVPLNSDAVARDFLEDQGYHPIDVPILATEARTLAMQIVVAREMSDQ